jgi:hypothetical protein
VGGGDAIQAMSGGGAQKEGVARPAAGGLHRDVLGGGQGRDVGRFEDGLDRKLGGKRGDEVRIGVGVRAAKAVVEMQDAENEAQLGSQCGEGAQQRDRVGSTADGETDPLPGAKKPAAAKVALEPGEHRTMIAEAARADRWSNSVEAVSKYGWIREKELFSCYYHAGMGGVEKIFIGCAKDFDLDSGDNEQGG